MFIFKDDVEISGSLVHKGSIVDGNSGIFREGLRLILRIGLDFVFLFLKLFLFFDLVEEKLCFSGGIGPILRFHL